MNTLEATAAQRDAASRLWDAKQSGQPCRPVRDLLGETDHDGAYVVQSLNVARQLENGRRVVGSKIGLTSAAVQTQFGVATPDYGVLLDDMVSADREPLELSSFLQPRVEAEVAFVLGSDLDTETANVADVLRATQFVLPAIEVVDSRISGWDIHITDTIADNASSGAVVLGTTPRALDGLDLASLGMALEHNGDVVSTGAGAACLGSPVIAVAWLARQMARRGRSLQAGEIVLSGALGPMVDVRRAGTYTARLHGLGEVRATFISPTPAHEGGPA